MSLVVSPPSTWAPVLEIQLRSFLRTAKAAARLERNGVDRLALCLFIRQTCVQDGQMGQALTDGQAFGRYVGWAHANETQRRKLIALYLFPRRGSAVAAT